MGNQGVIMFKPTIKYKKLIKQEFKDCEDRDEAFTYESYMWLKGYLKALVDHRIISRGQYAELSDYLDIYLEL